MKSISNHVREHLKDKPFIRDMMAKDLINSNALARDIRKEIESEIGEMVSLNSISMAVGRYQKQLKVSSEIQDPSKYIKDVTIQTGLAILNLPAPKLSLLFERIYNELKLKDECFILSQGKWYAGIIASKKIILSIKDKDILKDSEITTNIASLTVRLKPEHKDVLGVCAYIVGLLSHNGVNLEEIISTKDEMSIVINDSYLEAATKTLVNI